MRICLALAFAATACLGSLAVAQSPADVGHVLLRDNCARCHAIEKTGDSPHPSAPAFRALANSDDLDNLERSLRRGLQPGHPDMPAFKLSAEEAHAIAAYLRTIQQ